jgi:hypothetical protein
LLAGFVQAAGFKELGEVLQIMKAYSRTSPAMNVFALALGRFINPT